MLQHLQEHPLWILIRSIYFWILTFLTTLFWGILVHLVMPFRRPDLAHRLATKWGRTLSRLSQTRVTVEGDEKIHRDGPVIFVSNHQSLFDIIIFYTFLDVQFRWMAKASLFRIPILGSGMRGAGYIPVERGDKKKALKSLFDAAERVRNGSSVILFPEGTRGHSDGTMLPFKNGSFVLAKKAGVVLQPVTIWGANRIVPPDRSHLIQRIYPGTVRVILHDPILPEEYGALSVEQLSDKIREIIEAPMGGLRESHSLG